MLVGKVGTINSYEGGGGHETLYIKEQLCHVSYRFITAKEHPKNA